MDQLFAPWRIEWVTRGGDAGTEGCVFCELPGRGDDRGNRIVAETELAYVLLNNYPYNPGHAMVIPRHHTGVYADLTDDALLDHAKLTARTFEALKVAVGPDGFNAGLNIGSGSGGSITDHLHTHVVPRWQGDTNFMPVVGNTKVIVEALDETYGSLHAAFAEQAGATDRGPDRAVWVEAVEG